MRDELKKYGDEAYEMVEYAAREIGPRLPGSNNEKKYHDYMSDKLKELGLNPVTESFVFAPHASIGGLPYAGWAGIIGCVLTVLATILASLSAYAGLAMHFVCTMYMICTWIWLVVSVFKYHTCFDWCFKHKVSHNTYAIIRFSFRGTPTPAGRSNSARRKTNSALWEWCFAWHSVQSRLPPSRLSASLCLFS